LTTITIHRGTHQIGGSAVEIKTATGRILLDIGTPLDFDSRAASKLTGEELVAGGILPDIKGLYAWDKPEFDAVIISHAHLDHYGFAHFVHHQIPLYLSRGTQTLMDISVRFIGGESVTNRREIFKMYEPFAVAGMKITPYLMDHSAFDAAAFEIEAEGKRIVYTGDFRNHGRKPQTYERFINGVAPKADVLLCEGSMFGRSAGKSQTEDELELEITELLQQTDGAALFQCSAQNIDRMVTFYRASLRANRLFVIDVYAANVLQELRQFSDKLPAPSRDFGNIRVFFPYGLTKRIIKNVGQDFAFKFAPYKIKWDEIAARQNKILMLVRPSEQKNFLNRIGGLTNGAFIYSLWGGYRTDEKQNEKQIEFEQFLAERGFPCVEMHTSGHADLVTIRGLFTALDPKKIVPIHTFHPEAFGDFSDKVSIANDGEVIYIER
jgi:ribonuclease J